MTLKEEFRDVVDKRVRYCQGENHLPSAYDYDINVVSILFIKKKKNDIGNQRPLWRSCIVSFCDDFRRTDGTPSELPGH